VLKLGILIINSKKLEYCSYSQNFLEYPRHPAVVLLCEIIANCQVSTTLTGLTTLIVIFILFEDSVPENTKSIHCQMQCYYFVLLYAFV